MSRIVEKVTAFVTRPSAFGHELLLFEHPHAGIQIPAGTAEEEETPEAAVLREVREETGLSTVAIQAYLGCEESRLPEGQWLVAEPTRVYARPDATSFDWAYLRRGIRVAAGRQANGFSQITYEEPDQTPNSQYISMSITGWVPDGALAATRRRHFFHLEYLGPAEDRWSVFTDNHLFTLFWAPMLALPEIIPPQDEWIVFLRQGTHLFRDGVE